MNEQSIETTNEQTTTTTDEQTASPIPEPAPERRPYVPGSAELREAIQRRMPPITPPGFSEPIPDVARVAGGLVARVAAGGPPVVHPNIPNVAGAVAAQAQADRERAAAAALAARQSPRSPEERIADLERTVARLVQLVPGAAGR
jgi:hypothetical protein